MRRRSILIAVASVGVLAAGAIIAVTVYAAQSTPPTTLTQPTWTLTALVANGQEQALSSSQPATLRFGAHDGQISGTGGCNGYGGSYTLHGTRMQLGGVRATLIGCLDPVVSAQESHYFQALPRVTSYRIEGNTLTLSGDSGHVQLTFQAS